jgi:hypothetical protein
MLVAPVRAATVVAVLLAFCATMLSGGAAVAVERRADGITGYAFDARCAPTQEQMDAWLTSSPFWGAGIYVGGSMVSCRPTATDAGQPHLDATWVARQRAAGWRLLPIWVGPQAACQSGYGDLIDADPAADYAAADARGRGEAAAAVTRARELGLPAGSTLWYDLEGGFDVTSDDCRRSALRFLSGWTLALHDLGFRSGVYSSISAGIHALDNADHLSPGSYAMPDQVWYAWDNARADADIARAGSARRAGRASASTSTPCTPPRPTAAWRSPSTAASWISTEARSPSACPASAAAPDSTSPATPGSAPAARDRVCGPCSACCAARRATAAASTRASTATSPTPSRPTSVTTTSG